MIGSIARPFGDAIYAPSALKADCVLASSPAESTTLGLGAALVTIC
jgi:hypothetical protein